MEYPKQNAFGEPFHRLENLQFKKLVEEGFADLLEDRATDPEREGGADENLAALAEAVRRGEKIQRRPAALSIFRGVFFGGPMHDYRITQVEIDALEKDFFEQV
jgi:hypothetical protein